MCIVTYSDIIPNQILCWLKLETERYSSLRRQLYLAGRGGKQVKLAGSSFSAWVCPWLLMAFGRGRSGVLILYCFWLATSGGWQYIPVFAGLRLWTFLPSLLSWFLVTITQALFQRVLFSCASPSPLPFCDPIHMRFCIRWWLDSGRYPTGVLPKRSSALPNTADDLHTSATALCFPSQP